MKKKRVASATITAILGVGILLSSNVSYKENIALSTETKASMGNTGIIQGDFGRKKVALDHSVQITTENDRVEDSVSVLEAKDNEETLDNGGAVAHLERKVTTPISRGGLSRKHTNVEKRMTTEEIVKEVVSGRYGDGAERRSRLEREGYNYEDIQKEVSKQLQAESTVAGEQVKIATDSSVGNNSQVIKAYPHNTFKSYMRWTILNKSSPQYKICSSASADPETAIMMKDGRYLVALGFAYAGNIGEKIDVVMESGQVIPVIVGDWKAKEHTDKWNSASTNNGSIIEFIVSSNEAAAKATRRSGSYDIIFPGKVKEFRK